MVELPRAKKRRPIVVPVEAKHRRFIDRQRRRHTNIPAGRMVLMLIEAAMEREGSAT